MNMDSHCVIYAVVLLISLTHKFTFADIKNVTGERAVFTSKGSLKIFKPSWINLNNEWMKENQQSRCKNDIVTLFESANSGKKWALQMMDAMSKVPTGILMGNTLDLGMYDECIGVKSHQNAANIQGRHCMVSLATPSKSLAASGILRVQMLSIHNPSSGVNFGLTLSTCLPSSCNVQDLVGLVNASVRSIPVLNALEVNVVKVTCSGIESADGRTLGKTLALTFFATVAMIILSSTVCDVVVRRRSNDSSLTLKRFAQLSLYTNATKLLSTKVSPETLPAVHGVRFISTCLVVSGHRFLLGLTKPLVNISDILKWCHSPTASVGFAIPRSVDSFFVLSGFLTAHMLLKALRSGRKFTVPMLYFHRYLRFTPTMVAFIIFTIFIYPDLGSGPIWDNVMGVTRDYCRKNWWLNLLYLNNFVNRDEMCIPHTWYLSTEMHLFWICPIVLYPLHHRPKLGLVLLGLLTATSFVIPGVNIAANKWAALFDLNNTNFTLILNRLVNSHTLTHHRALPYFIGILLGYDVVNNKRRISTTQVTCSWILTCIMVLLCILVNFYVQPIAFAYNVAWEVAHVTVVRLGWSVAFAWILYACTQGYGGPVTRFLELPIFVPLSRLSYCIYFIHPFLQLWTNATLRTSAFFSPVADLYPITSDLVICIAAAFVVTLFFEVPSFVLEKYLLQKPLVSEKSSSAQHEEKCLTINQHQSDSTRYLSCSDPVNGEKTSNPVAEWAKIWQDWKCNVMKDDTHRGLRQEVIENGSTGIESEATRLEKEFLKFLTALSCDSNQNASSEELDILVSARSQLVFYNSQNDNSRRSLRSEATPVDKKTQ